MKYSIGEFSERLGITVDTIRLYEKYGIIHPIKDHKNNYRYFDDLDARNLLMSRWFRSLEIPLHDVSDLILDPSLDGILGKIEYSQENLTKQIQKSTILLNKINEIKNDIINLKSSLYTFNIKKISGIYRLKHTNRDSLLKDDILKSNICNWMNILPYSFFSLRIERQSFLAGEKAFQFDWGLAMSEQDLDKFPLEIGENIEYVNPNTCLSSIILQPCEEDIVMDNLQFMIDYMNENNYSLAGDIMGKLILTERIGDQRRSYIQINIPINCES